EGPPPGWARPAGSAANTVANATTGLGGDFVTVLASLRAANDADVVFATVDTVGIPLVLLKAARGLRPPLVYASIGLSERLGRRHGDRRLRILRGAFRSARALVTYSTHEADVLREW